MNTHKHEKNREVSLDDITTLSKCMSANMTRYSPTKPLNNKSNDFDNAEFDDYDYNGTVTPPLFVEKDIDFAVSSESLSSSDDKTKYNKTPYNTPNNTPPYETENKNKKKYKYYKRYDISWSVDIENVIKGWHNKCLQYAETHHDRAIIQRRLFYFLGITSSIIPLILASLNDTLNEEFPILTLVFLIITGILNTITGFINPGKKAEAHLNFEALYNELAVEITSELVKPSIYRQNAHVFIQRIMDNYNNLNNRAPST